MRAKRIANLSSEAKAVEEQVHAIFEDDNLSRKQTCEKVNEIVSKASNAIKTELRLRVHDCDMPPNMPQNPLNNRRG
jgi:F0F1-type ATP synthase membrane subunit b/b'